MENIVFDTANLSDIPELMRLRIAFAEADLDSVSESDKREMTALGVVQTVSHEI